MHAAVGDSSSRQPSLLMGLRKFLEDNFFNNKTLEEKKALKEVSVSAFSWTSVVGKNRTTIYANFNGHNPNANRAEIAVREGGIVPGTRKGVTEDMDYVTIEGITVEKYAGMAPGGFFGHEKEYLVGGINLRGGDYWVIRDVKVVNHKGIGRRDYQRGDSTGSW